ncbi:uncharacterized protein JCM15063_003050 [Sporobolomyces koalae]|uniref:uncharacterized protein n=1 Tax=Sporobolomyces koalae TaxID=500713 RepID=UPI003176E141
MPPPTPSPDRLEIRSTSTPVPAANASAAPLRSPILADPATAQSSSGTTSLDTPPRESSGGAGDESDDEAETSGNGSGSGGQARKDSQDAAQRAALHHHEMYPFPLMPHQQFQRHSSAEVEASSAGSDSSDLSMSESDTDDDDDNKDASKKKQPDQDGNARPVTMPKRTLSEYRASLSRAGLAVAPRIRRIGALGISVHSESDVENPQISGLDTNDRLVSSRGDTSTGTRETDLGVSLDTLQAGTGSGSQSGGSVSKRKRRRGIADATFRGIVDELAIQNRHLKDKLRRYEAHGVPSDLKEKRLFEIRFYDGLPIDQRCELESFLTHYVQSYIDKSAASQSEPHAVKPDPSPQQVRCSLPSPQESVDLPQRVTQTENPALAGASNSGVEPISISGIGSGLYRPGLPSHPQSSYLFPLAERESRTEIQTPHDRETATLVVAALEQLFRRSLRQSKGESDAAADKRSRSNETYMANFLSHDYLTDGWVYLNLASTMAELHKFSVTLSFVQESVRECSSNLEVSTDGKRIRWIGASPSPSPPPSSAPELEVVKSGSLPPSSATPRADASPGASESRTSSGATTQGSEHSDPSSAIHSISNTFANSLAPTASTAATSHTQSSQTKTARPQRPTAAVFQRMDRLAPTPPSSHPSAAKATQQPLEGNSLSASKPARTSAVQTELSQSKRRALYHDILRNRIEAEREASDDEQALTGKVPSRGPGMLVFYANGHFCSDLTREEPSPEEAKSKQVFFGAISEGASDAESDHSESPMSFDLDDEVDLVGWCGESDRESFEAEERSSVASQASSLQQLCVSGMTSTTPADLFTVVVKTSHPRKRERTFLEEPPSTSKRRRIAFPATRILSSKAFHHRPMMTRRDARVSLADDLTSGDNTHHHVSSRRFRFTAMRSILIIDELLLTLQLTTSNLAKHTHPSLAAMTPPLEKDDRAEAYDDTPSPPHDDYLLSLSAPLHAWAPRDIKIVDRPSLETLPQASKRVSFHRRLINPYPSRTTSDLSTTGDERPISLDDPVGVRSTR